MHAAEARMLPSFSAGLPAKHHGHEYTCIEPFNCGGVSSGAAGVCVSVVEKC